MGRYYTRSKAREERERSLQGDSINDDTENSSTLVIGNDSFYDNSESSIVTEDNEEDESVTETSHNEPTRQRFKLIQNKKEMTINASITEGTKSPRNKRSSKSRKTEGIETSEIVLPPYKDKTTKITQNRRNHESQKTEGTQTPEMVSLLPKSRKTGTETPEVTKGTETVTNITSSRGLHKLIILILAVFIILSVVTIYNNHSIRDCHEFVDFIEAFRRQNNLTDISRPIKIVKLFLRHFMDIKRPDPAVLMIIYDDSCGYDKSLNFSRGLANILSKDPKIFDLAYLEEFSSEGQTRLGVRINAEVGQVNVFASLNSYPTAVLQLFFAFCDHENYMFANSAFIITVNVPEEDDMGDIPESLWDLHEDSRLALNSRIAKNVLDFRPLACWTC